MDFRTGIEKDYFYGTSPGGFSALLDAAVDAIVIIDSEGQIRSANVAAERIFGYTIDELQRGNISMLMPRPYREHHGSYIGRYMETGTARIIGIGRRVEAINKQGEVFPIELSVGEYTEKGQQFFIGIIRDITERVRVLDELEKSRHDLRLREQDLNVTLTNAPIGIFTASARGIMLTANRAACNLTGRQESEIVGRHCFRLIHEESWDEIRSNHHALITGRLAGFEQLTRVHTRDGEIRQVRLHCAAVMDWRGTPERLIAQLVDITDQVKAENDARAIREKFAHIDRISTMGEMASGIAHEINQPLSAISSYVQACLKRLGGADPNLEKIRELLEKVDEQSQRAGAIVRRIRSLIRPHQHEMEAVDVRELVADAISLAESDANDRGVTISTRLMKAPRKVLVDRIQIQQVVLNLVRNAVDATGDTGGEHRQVIVGSRMSGDPGHVEVWVRDFGPGIDETVRATLFDSFVTSKHAGTGMGLSISRSIIEAHNGSIGLTELDDGVRFSFQLPIYDK